jgi:hypothetical protein
VLCSKPKTRRMSHHPWTRNGGQVINVDKATLVRSDVEILGRVLLALSRAKNPSYSM